MNDLDRRIQEALRESGVDESLAREPGMGEELIATFRGRNRWLHALAVAFSFAFFAIAVWSGFRFYGSETVREQLQWGGGCIMAMLAVAFIKVYIWMEMHTNRVMRELKRIELLFLQRRE